MKRLFALSLGLGLSFCTTALGQGTDAVERVLNQFTAGVNTGRVSVDSIKADSGRTLVYASTNFSYVSFNRAKCDAIISRVKAVLPANNADNEVHVITGGVDIRDLIPRYLRPKADKPAVFTQDKTVPLVRNLSRPYTPTRGLEGRHIAMWQSHGLYFEPGRQRWQWQRGRMFQTVEDKYTQRRVPMC